MNSHGPGSRTVGIPPGLPAPHPQRIARAAGTRSTRCKRASLGMRVGGSLAEPSLQDSASAQHPPEMEAPLAGKYSIAVNYGVLCSRRNRSSIRENTQFAGSRRPLRGGPWAHLRSPEVGTTSFSTTGDVRRLLKPPGEKAVGARADTGERTRRELTVRHPDCGPRRLTPTGHGALTGRARYRTASLRKEDTQHLSFAGPIGPAEIRVKTTLGRERGFPASGLSSRRNSGGRTVFLRRNPYFETLPDEPASV
jgi:hypothetical protein